MEDPVDHEKPCHVGLDVGLDNYPKCLGPSGL